MVEWLVEKASGGEVVITGLDGALPNHLRALHVELRDTGGPWIRADHVSLDWSALPAVWNHVAISRLTADRILLLRQPQARNSTSGATPRIDVDAFLLPNIALASALVGHPATLTARGSFRYVSRHEVNANINVTRKGNADRYVVQGAILSDVANGQVTVSEGDDGLLGKLIGLPGLSPVNLSAMASGSRGGNTMSLTLSAGKLSARGHGTLSLADRQATFAFDAEAPAMRLDSTRGWASLKATGRFTGGFNAPDVRANIRIADFTAGGFHIAAMIGEVGGMGGRVNASARLEGLHIPGTAPNVFADAPVQATLMADLARPERPLKFSLRHPLVRLEGSAHTRGNWDVQTILAVSSLAPFGRVLGGDIAGSASASLKAALDGGNTVLTLESEIKSSGSAIAARLLGRATARAHAVLSGGDVLASSLTLDGVAFASRVTGEWRAGQLNYDGSLTLKDLSRLTPFLTGRAKLSGHVAGPAAKALVAATGTADVASPGFARERVNISLQAVGLPQPGSATIKMHGRFDNAPLTLDAALSRRGAARAVKIAGGWRSAVLRAQFALPAKETMTGHGTLDIKSLNDLAPFTGISAQGALHVMAQLTAVGEKRALVLKGRTSDIKIAGSELGLATIDGVVADPFAKPVLSLNFQVSKFYAGGWTGGGRGEVQGSPTALALKASAKLDDPEGAPAVLTANAVLDVRGHSLSMRQMKASWRGETAVLAAPAEFQFAEGLDIAHLKVRVGAGTINMSGRITPKLNIAMSAESIKAEAVSLFLPQLSISGTLSANADLSGTLTSPQGVISLRGRGLRSRVYAVTAAPAVDLDAHAVLHGKSAAVNGTLTDGKSAHLTLGGEAPLEPDGALNLRLAGSADLVLLDPFFAADGQRLRGTLQIDTIVAGTLTSPRFRGLARLADGEFQDFARGIRLREIGAKLMAQKDGIHIVALSAQAGPGTINANGTVDAWSPGIPLDITLRADNARPIVSDLLTAVLSGSARLSGKLQQDLVLKGAITVPRAEITLPQSFPPEVRTLNVRHRGQSPPPPDKQAAALKLDLTIRATGPVILRGRGIDADLGGNLEIGGLARAPRIGGGFEMKRGTLTLAGQVLSFTSGKVTFDGTGVRGRLDPALDFVANETSGGITATLAVGGYVSQPKITLSSSPRLPQDEVLARLLFQQSAKQLSPLQLAEGAQALASISGFGSGFSPLASLRGGLGLDRLSVESGNGTTSGTTVEAGKYVSRNVYIGAKQGISGGTEAQVQIDLTKNLKAQATVSAGANAKATQGAVAAQESSGSFGLSYQFDY